MEMAKAWLSLNLKELKLERGYRHSDRSFLHNPLCARTEEVIGGWEGPEEVPNMIRKDASQGGLPGRSKALIELKWQASIIWSCSSQSVVLSLEAPASPRKS